MKPRLFDRLSAGFAGLARGKSLAAFSAAFMRGDDVMERPARDALTRPYLQSAWVRAAVEHVAGEIAGRNLCFFAGDTEFEGDPAFAAFWAAPALGPKTLAATQPRLPLGEVLHQLAAWIALEGEFFLLFDDTWALAELRRNPAALSPFIIANPKRVRLIVQSGQIEGYEYVDASGYRTVFLPEQVIHYKSFNPYDWWRGAGALAAAHIAAEGAFSTGVYIRDLMWNNGDQGFIVIGKNGVADDKQREQIVSDLRAKRAALRRGIPKDLFLTGDITVDHPPERAASAELMDSMSLSHQEVFIAFGVPPSMCEVKASYSIGKDSDYYQLIIRTCRPKGIKICGALATVAGRMVALALTAELDWNEHPVMVEVRNGRIDSGLKLWGAGMPMEQVNDYLGLGMAEYPGWEIGYLPFNVAPAVDPMGAAATSPQTDPALAEGDTEQPDSQPEEEDDEVKTLRLLVLARAKANRPDCTKISAAPGAAATPPQSDAFAAFECRCHAQWDFTEGRAAVAQRADRPARELAQWRDLMAKRRATVKSFKSAFGRVLMQARVETLRHLETWSAKSATPETKNEAPGTTNKAGAASHLLFDLTKFTLGFNTAMENNQKTGLDTAGTQMLAELGLDDPFKLPPAEVLAFLAARKNKLSGVPQEVYDRLKAQLEEGLKAGETTAQLSARVKTIFNGIADGDAQRIALTETSAVYGAGRAAAMEQAGVQWKQWLTSGNANVRAAHRDANGQTVAADEPFIVDGEELSYPGDDAGSAGNVINCHCVSIAVATGPKE